MKAGSTTLKSTQPHPKIFDLSYGEKGMWYLWRTAPESRAYPYSINLFMVLLYSLIHFTYNITFYPKFKAAEFDAKLMGKCWEEVTARHHMMRTTIIEDEDTGIPKHLVHDEWKNPYEVITPATEAELVKELNKAYLAPFDLINGPLYRLTLFSRGDEHTLMVAAHRIFILHNKLKLF